MKKFSILLLPAALLGCASSPPNLSTQNVACISGGMANFIKYYSEGEAHVFIKSIDGVSSGISSPDCFPPGKHSIGISAGHMTQGVRGAFEFEFMTHKNYKLDAHVQGGGFLFDLSDITIEPAIKVSEFTLDSNTSTTLVIPGFGNAPIVIPGNR